MKTLTKLFLLVAISGLLVSCEKSDHFWDDDPLDNTEKGSPVESVMVTIPLKCDFTVWDHSDWTDTRCGGLPVLYAIMIGEGKMSHLGTMTTSMTFCMNIETGEYYDAECTFVAANGDELYGVIPLGYCVPNEGDNSDYYQGKFDDPLYFTGGTGRFEGATGEVTTNAWIHDPTPDDEVWHTDFFSTGTLILVKK